MDLAFQTEDQHNARVCTDQRIARLAVLTTHPIQYQVPLFRAVAQIPNIDLTVLFCSDYGIREYRDAGFGKTISWDLPLLDGYSYEFLNNSSLRPSLSTFWGMINPGLVIRLRGGRFDAILVHGWYPFTNLLGIIAGSCLGVPVILRGDSNVVASSTSRKLIAKKQILPRLFSHVSAFLAIGRANAEFYRAYGVSDEKIFLAPYAVDNAFFFSQAERLKPQRAQLRSEIGLQLDQPVVLFVGKLSEAKAPMDLLKAFAKVRTRVPSSLVFVGDGILRTQLEKYALDNSVPDVHFLGFRNQTELGKFYSTASVFVLPSIFEPWGLVVNEAMCFSLPLIISDRVGAGRDLVRDAINGYLYPSGDVDGLANKLQKLLSNPTSRQRMGNASRQLIELNSFDSTIKGLQGALYYVTQSPLPRAL